MSTKMSSWYSITLWLYAVLFRSYESISACDDVDISFFIDSNWVTNGDNDKIIEFITRIIEDGSAENAAFNAVIYGNNNIPINQKIKIFDIDETSSIVQRQKEIEFVEDRLMNAFKKIKDTTFKPNKQTKTVTLNTAIKTGLKSKKDKRVRKHRKTEILLNHLTNQQDKNIKLSLHDDENVIFIFHFDNMLGNNGDICDIINNQQEDLHFLFGQEFTNADTSINCDNQTDALISFRLLDDDLLNDSQQMEEIYSISCPAEITSDDGYMNLGNHVQWIDENTIIECKLDNEAKYVLIKDYINDDNTFQINDYLIADIMTFNVLPEGCYSSVYKIINIITENEEEQQDYVWSEKFVIRKLLIRFPKTPQEYILETKTSGVHQKLYSKNDLNANRRRTAWDTIGRSGDLNLISLSYGDSKEITKSASFEGTKNLWSGATAEFSGEVEVTIDTGYSFDINIDLEYDFSWRVFTGDLHIEFAIIGSWEVAAWFNLGIKGSAEIQLNNLLDYDHLFTFQAGVVPILIKPFINIGGKIELVPIEINAGIQCSYGESYKIGYYYDKKNYYEGPYDTFRDGYRYKTDKLSKKMDRYDVGSLNACIGMAYEKGNCEWVDYKAATNSHVSFNDPVDGSYLAPGDVLNVGDVLRSQNGWFRAVVQGDGNFVVYGSVPEKCMKVFFGQRICVPGFNGAMWASGTNAGTRLVLQGDGNVVLYGSGGAKWASGTNAGGGCCSTYLLIMENGGNLALYDGSGKIKWGSGHTNDGRSQCRCFSGANYGYITQDSAWDSYVLDVNCGGLKTECAGCGTKFWIRKKASNVASCAFFDKWECRECPIWTHFSGKWTTSVDKHDIFDRTVDSNTCSTSITTGDGSNSETSCPVLELGFDATLEVQIGAYFYEVIKTYVKAELVFPFRINLPVLNPADCGNSASTDMCSLTWLRASMSYELVLNVYFGFEITIEELVETVQQLIDGASQVIETDLTGTEIKLFSLTIIDETTQCMRLDNTNGLSFLTSIFKGLCC